MIFVAVELPTPNIVRVTWPQTHRIVRSQFPPIDLFEDIADPADWDAIISAETKTNPRIAESIGMLDLVPEGKRIAGTGASWAMAPFVHTSTDRQSRFTDGSYGVYYAGNSIEVALFETIYHHGKFMAATKEASGWTSDFRELISSIDVNLHDISDRSAHKHLFHPDKYTEPQAFANELRKSASNGLLYQSVRFPEGLAVALFWPNIVGLPMQGQHFSYYWDGEQVTRVKNLTSGEVFSVTL